MPKQVYKIENFHGGLNSDADPRDIDENQLSTLSGFVVDEIGKVRMMGGLADHGAPDPTDGTLRAGYGLFYFTADRKGGHVTPHGNTLSGTHSMGVASVTMTNNGSGYTGVPDVVFGAPNVSGGVRATGTAVVDEADEVASVTMVNNGSGYTSVPTVTIGGVTSGGGVSAAGNAVLQTNLAYLSDVTEAWPVDGLIGALLKNTTDGSEIVITDNTATTAIGTLAGGTDNDWDIADAYTITEFPETGDDYLIHVDCDSTCAALIYSRVSNTWSPAIYPINLGTTATIEPTFYAVDGAVRVSDGNFGSGNTNQWYGYISREFLPTLGGNSVKVDKWQAIEQKIGKPAPSSEFDEATQTASTAYSTEYVTLSETTNTSIKKFETENQIYDDSNAQKVGDYAGGEAGFSNVGKIVVVVTATAFSSVDNELAYTVTAGEGVNSGSVFTSDSQSQYTEGTVTHGGYSKIFTFYFNVTGTEAIEIANGENTQGVLVTLTDNGNGSNITNFQISSAKAFEGYFTGSAHSNLAADNVMFEIDGASATGASGWSKDWNVGVSFIYDEVQESLIRELLDVDDDAATCTIGSGEAPDIKLSIKYVDWNPRITGINLYMREATTITKESWFLQAHFDLIKGVGIAYPNGVDNDFVYESSLAESQCTIPKEQVIEPNLVDSYQLVAGMEPDEKSIISKYNTAVVVNRVVYIGGLEVEYEDGKTEVMGDAMIKSPVNKFDLFPLSRIIEVSVRDGDSIVKLEEYADRILQFKKHKMHLVNVSQEVEFLEDTFMHKGVSTPAAVCKTDFGVAWVNKHGCYLYDGNRVNNLLEKGGRRLISDAEWVSFVTEKDESDDNPGGSMIGYIPKKRQLIVVKDGHENTDSGDIYLFDMITQSWSFGDSKLVGTAGSVERKTNFVNDWNGDLVHLNDEANGSVFKWDDGADADKNASLITKDIDFGQPSVRKKIYKVYLTYKGNGAHVQVHYGVNGLRPTSTFFPITSGTDGSTTGTGATAKCIAYDAGTTDWLKAELKPGSSVNNISSIMLKISGDGTNAIASDFEINDISIVYRLKNIK